MRLPRRLVGAIFIERRSFVAVGEIENTIAVFERLRKYQYRIAIENGLALTLRFSRENYHHLAGFQHLTDMPDIAQPRRKDEFYNRLLNGKISTERLTHSAKYHEIEERLKFFSVIEQILSAGEGKIIVEFDRRKTDSVIEAKFHLFHRDGNPLVEAATYYTLFLDRDRGENYFPVTYVVEHSNMYVKNQQMFGCTIEQVPSKHKKVPVGV